LDGRERFDFEKVSDAADHPSIVAGAEKETADASALASREATAFGSLHSCKTDPSTLRLVRKSPIACAYGSANFQENCHR
jgi:hypothetical protein